MAEASTNEMIGAIAQTLLNDMSRRADLRVELSEEVGYNKGYEAGYVAGQAAVACRLRNFLFGIQNLAELMPKENED